MILIIVILLVLLLALGVYHICWRKNTSVTLAKIKDDESRLIHLEKMASLGTLSAGIAHEINNPLAFINTDLEVLSKYIDAACAASDEKIRGEKINEIRQIIQECRDGTERIKRIVQDLLLFSHPSSGKKVLVDVNSLLDVAVRILWNHIKYKAEIIKDYQAVSKVWIDSNQLSQVFFNLIINSTQAIKDRGTITMSTREDDSHIKVKISDTGCGMDKMTLSKIFTAFYTTKGGTGLGLFLSRNIIKELGGSIEVESVVGKGTSFTVIIPKTLA